MKSQIEEGRFVVWSTISTVKSLVSGSYLTDESSPRLCSISRVTIGIITSVLWLNKLRGICSSIFLINDSPIVVNSTSLSMVSETTWTKIWFSLSRSRRSNASSPPRKLAIGNRFFTSSPEDQIFSSSPSSKTLASSLSFDQSDLPPFH